MVNGDNDADNIGDGGIECVGDAVCNFRWVLFDRVGGGTAQRDARDPDWRKSFALGLRPGGGSPVVHPTVDLSDVAFLSSASKVVLLPDGCGSVAGDASCPMIFPSDPGFEGLEASGITTERLYIADVIDGDNNSHGIWVFGTKGFTARNYRCERITDDCFVVQWSDQDGVLSATDGTTALCELVFYTKR